MILRKSSTTMEKEKRKKFRYQENQYKFPYHHIPYLDNQNNVINHRSINWGFKYFCYLLRIKSLVEELNPSSILDVGCGEGRFLGLLENNARKVGVDLSAKPISFARAFHPEIEFYAKDAAELSEEFDMVTAIEVLEHIPDEEVSYFLKILEERTKPGGHVILSIPTTVVPVSPKHYRHYNIEILKEQLNASQVDFKIISVQYVYRSSFFLKFYSKITQNKFWIIEIKAIRNFIWKLVRFRYAKAGEKNGEEMVVILKKIITD